MENRLGRSEILLNPVQVSAAFSKVKGLGIFYQESERYDRETRHRVASK